ncbi:MAG: histone deacetylase family protein [Methanotrichaceae archaeon]|nr:histone deacetylase family protein [Methanotrichaceae archaeon]
MKIIYSKKFEQNYCTNPVENPDRVKLPAQELQAFEFLESEPASLEDIWRVHGKEHVENVKYQGLFEAASLAAGGAILAAEKALEDEPTFALIRPPGHHASANRSWGLCFFNNMAIAVQRIRPKAKRVLIVDIDLHFGDGTVSIFRGDSEVKIINPGCIDADFEYLNLNANGYMKQVENAFKGFDFDIVGVSAGFDTYIEDWGKVLKTEDYRKIGRIIHDFSQRCGGKRFAILEGGYNQDLRYNIESFIEGFE